MSDKLGRWNSWRAGPPRPSGRGGRITTAGACGTDAGPTVPRPGSRVVGVGDNYEVSSATDSAGRYNVIII